MIVKEILAHPSSSVSGGLVRPGSKYEGDDVGQLAVGYPIGKSVTADTSQCFDEADVVIDFTLPESVPGNADAAIVTKTPWVVGTTGLSPEQDRSLRAASQEVPVVFASNMSLGINLLFALVEQVATALDDNFDIEILDFHHNQKVDSPSGTAISLGEAAARGRGVKFRESSTMARDGLVGVRPRGEIGFAALRGGSVVGEHSVMFVSSGERVELHHKASDRGIYAAGAVVAAHWLKDRPPGLYTMRDVLGIES
tara:strand:- start:861 stop:1622 length:762 start_codon:yes stop_codon:yes gene_type:complete